MHGGTTRAATLDVHEPGVGAIGPKNVAPQPVGLLRGQIDLAHQVFTSLQGCSAGFDGVLSILDGQSDGLLALLEHVLDRATKADGTRPQFRQELTALAEQVRQLGLEAKNSRGGQFESYGRHGTQSGSRFHDASQRFDGKVREYGRSRDEAEAAEASRARPARMLDDIIRGLDGPTSADRLRSAAKGDLNPDEMRLAFEHLLQRARENKEHPVPAARFMQVVASSVNDSNRDDWSAALIPTIQSFEVTAATRKASFAEPKAVSEKANGVTGEPWDDDHRVKIVVALTELGASRGEALTIDSSSSYYSGMTAYPGDTPEDVAMRGIRAEGFRLRQPR